MRYSIFTCALLAILFLDVTSAVAESYQVTSPNGEILLTVDNGERLTYSIRYRDNLLVDDSPMGFEFKDEEPMLGGFVVCTNPVVESKIEAWDPVVRNKYAHVEVPYNGMVMQLQEPTRQYRRMDVEWRVMNDGVAFRYTLYGSTMLGNRQVTREVTGFNVPAQSSLWVPDVNYYDSIHPYRSSQEGVFHKTPVTQIGSAAHCCLPGLIEVDESNWMAILQANLDNWPAFYIGAADSVAGDRLMLTTKLTPVWGEQEEGGVKARFSEKNSSAWHIVMVGDNPGKFIESEIVHSLNPDCVLDDVEWIRPGISAWDHWWSGECLMEMEPILQYIDLAVMEGWPYMLIDWTWYGPYNTPEALVTHPAPQLDMPAILEYAKDRGIGIWLWMRCEDANHNDAYKEAFATYEKWGVAGVKIDFMDRDDQDMVNWYRKIIKATAEHHLMLDLHGAYCPDGIDRTYPHMITREGVMGSEYYKFSKDVTPEHNVNLAFTRMLAGQMDYTPGGFLNVHPRAFRNTAPTQVTDTRSAELAKFVVYDSPFAVFCDHPDNVYGQDGEEFLRVVPTVWDSICFLGGAPDEYVAIAKKSGTDWYVGVLNNSKSKYIELDLSFIGNDNYSLESWSDNQHYDTAPRVSIHRKNSFNPQKRFKIRLSSGGGYVGIIRMESQR